MHNIIAHSNSKAFSFMLRTAFLILYLLAFPLQNMEGEDRCKEQRCSLSGPFCHMVLRFCTGMKLKFSAAETINNTLILANNINNLVAKSNAHFAELSSHCTHVSRHFTGQYFEYRKWLETKIVLFSPRGKTFKTGPLKICGT